MWGGGGEGGLQAIFNCGDGARLRSEFAPTARRRPRHRSRAAFGCPPTAPQKVHTHKRARAHTHTAATLASFKHTPLPTPCPGRAAVRSDPSRGPEPGPGPPGDPLLSGPSMQCLVPRGIYPSQLQRRPTAPARNAPFGPTESVRPWNKYEPRSFKSRYYGRDAR